jgi:hypothetical protein
MWFAGHRVVEGCVVLSQLGFCTAYVIFITQNLARCLKLPRDPVID